MIACMQRNRKLEKPCLFERDAVAREMKIARHQALIAAEMS